MVQAKNIKSATAPRLSSSSRVVLWSVAFAAFIGACTLIRWNDWNYGYDLGIFAQAVANVPSGFADRPEFGTHFRFHFSPILALLWPLLAVFRTPLVLQWAQIALITAVTPLTYILARRYYSERWAIWIALLTLANPFLYSQAFNEFHAVSFFPALALSLLWALDRGRWMYAMLFALLIFCVREDAAVTTVFALLFFSGIGLYRSRVSVAAPRGLLYLEPEQPAQLAAVSAVLACTGAAIVSAYFLYANAHLGGWEPASFYRYTFASTPAGVLWALFAIPAVAWPQVVSLGRIGYLLEALACVIFLPLRSLFGMLVAPGMLVVLLANSMGVWRIGAQYALIWLPWMILAFAAAGLALDERSRFTWFRSCAVILTVLALVGNPLHLGTYLRPSYGDIADARLALASVGDRPLSTHDEWQTQISVSDPYANSRLSSSSRWFVYASDYPNVQFQTRIKPQLEELLARRAIRVVRRYGNVIVYERERANSALWRSVDAANR